MTLTFIVPMPETQTNSGKGRSRHWRAAYAEKMAYWNTLDLVAACRRNKLAPFPGMQIPLPPSEPFVRVSVRSLMHLGGAMDDDNAMARHKPLLDWLKTRGYLLDDRKKNIVWEGLPEQSIKRDGNYRIELSLTPL